MACQPVTNIPLVECGNITNTFPVVAETWPPAIDKLFKTEGGAVNNPKDTGGATYKGVTLKAWRDYKQDDAITFDELKATSDDDLKRFYKKMYWTPISGDLLPKGLDYAVFDMAVNSGTPQAIKTLQRAIGAVPDGHLGPKSFELLRKVLISNLIVEIDFVFFVA